MDQENLLMRLKVLCPDQGFSIWPENGDYFGESIPTIRFGYRVDWRHEEECPSESEILSVSQEQIDNLREEAVNLDLMIRYENDLTMKMLYKNELKTRPELTYIEFLKEVNGYQV